MESSPPEKIQNRRVHMANERTFLAWIRTSVAIMAFGFVIEKFALFMKQLSAVLHKAGVPGWIDQHPLYGHSAVFGMVPVGVGIAMGVLAFIRYKKVQRDIELDRYRPSLVLDALLALCVFTLGAFLLLYLFRSAY